MKKINYTLLITLILTISVYAQTKKPKRIIFMIGDGMGLAQISGALAFYAWQNAFERFGNIGLMKTNSSDSYVTDSAAGATAFSIGKKTYNGAIGVDSLGNASETIFETLKKQTSWGTGIVATSSITHATPAAFYAHAKSRKESDAIAYQLLNSYCDIAVSGGRKYLQQKGNINLIDSLTKLGFEVNVNGSLKNSKAAKQIQALDEDGLPKMLNGRGDFLPKASMHAINVLGLNYKNYFLMIEGSQIDWGGHDTDFNYMKTELLDFNATINDVLDFAAKDGETLVVVTADHETGGLTLQEDYNNKIRNLIPVHTTTKHTGIMVPVFAYGPGSEMFRGVYHNTEIYHKFKSLINLK